MKDVLTMSNPVRLDNVIAKYNTWLSLETQFIANLKMLMDEYVEFDNKMSKYTPSEPYNVDNVKKYVISVIEKLKVLSAHLHIDVYDVDFENDRILYELSARSKTGARFLVITHDIK